MKKRTVFSIIFLQLLLFITFGNLMAQTPVTISGQVSDKSTHKKLSGANIVVEGTGRGTISDYEGKYKLQLPAGHYILSAGFMGYKVAKVRANVMAQPLQLDFELTPQILEGQPVMITATRAKERETPVVFTDIPRREISDKYWSQDVPMLLAEVPGVYAYSDAGNGIGYSCLKIRGFDQKRVSVMLNGIPLNDPEDHQVYWVNMPDFLASVQDIQLQRGVGSSLYGSSSFGGTVNMITHEHNSPQKISLALGSGSFNTRKFSMNLHSGLINNRYAVAGRFSKILSDNYRDNSAVDMWSYFLSAARYGFNSTLKLNVYGGPQLTHAAWEASPQSELKKNHRHNPYQYKNTIDSFHQPHYELLHEWMISKNMTLHNSLFYIHGKGYYEGLKKHKSLYDFGYPEFFVINSDTVEKTDLVRQKWVEKDQLGWISRLDWQHSKRGSLTLGADCYTFRSDHWGRVTWAAQLPSGSRADHTYYRYTGQKNFGTFFAHELYHITPQLALMADFNLQLQKYTFGQKQQAHFRGANRHAYEVTHTFFNPKFGANYNISNKLNVFGNVAISHREPSDDDLFDVWDGPDDIGKHPLFARADTVYAASGQVDHLQWHDPQTKPERVIDYELGVGYQGDFIQVKLNAYWMDFCDEIVPYSQVDKDGFPIKGNADRTVHRGIESAIGIKLMKGFRVAGSLSMSQNYFAGFNQYEAVYDDNWNFVGTKAIDFSGKTIAGFPGVMANGRLSYASGPVGCSLQLQHFGKQYLDNTENETRSIAAYTLFNAQLSYQLGNIPGLESVKLGLWVNNILDKKYETAGYYDNWNRENYLWPGAGRNFFVNLETSL